MEPIIDLIWDVEEDDEKEVVVNPSSVTVRPMKANCNGNPCACDTCIPGPRP